MGIRSTLMKMWNENKVASVITLVVGGVALYYLYEYLYRKGHHHEPIGASMQAAYASTQPVQPIGTTSSVSPSAIGSSVTGPTDGSMQSSDLLPKDQNTEFSQMKGQLSNLTMLQNTPAINQISTHKPKNSNQQVRSDPPVPMLKMSFLTPISTVGPRPSVVAYDKREGFTNRPKKSGPAWSTDTQATAVATTTNSTATKTDPAATTTDSTATKTDPAATTTNPTATTTDSTATTTDSTATTTNTTDSADSFVNKHFYPFCTQVGSSLLLVLIGVGVIGSTALYMAKLCSHGDKWWCMTTSKSDDVEVKTDGQVTANLFSQEYITLTSPFYETNKIQPAYVFSDVNGTGTKVNNDPGPVRKLLDYMVGQHPTNKEINYWDFYMATVWPKLFRWVNSTRTSIYQWVGGWEYDGLTMLLGPIIIHAVEFGMVIASGVMAIYYHLKHIEIFFRVITKNTTPTYGQWKDLAANTGTNDSGKIFTNERNYTQFGQRFAMTCLYSFGIMFSVMAAGISMVPVSLIAMLRMKYSESRPRLDINDNRTHEDHGGNDYKSIFTFIYDNMKYHQNLLSFLSMLALVKPASTHLGTWFAISAIIAIVLFIGYIKPFAKDDPSNMPTALPPDTVSPTGPMTIPTVVTGNPTNKSLVPAPTVSKAPIVAQHSNKRDEYNNTI